MTIQLPKPLSELLARPGLTDLVINGHSHTYIDVGDGLQRTINPFDSQQELFEFLIELGFQTGSRIDMAKPISDFMVDGFRFHAVQVGIVAFVRNEKHRVGRHECKEFEFPYSE